MTDVRQIYSKAQIRTEPYDTRINALGEIYTAGRFDNVMAFGDDTIREQWDTDMFIAKFGLPCPTYIYDTATYCYGDVVQDVTLTASGDYTFTYPEGAQEFDSIVLVHATVLPPLTIGLNDTTVCTAQQFYLDACGEFDSYQWSTGGTGCSDTKSTPTTGQAIKSARGMPWHQEPKKDVTSCDKLRGGANIR